MGGVGLVDVGGLALIDTGAVALIDMGDVAPSSTWVVWPSLKGVASLTGLLSMWWGCLSCALVLILALAVLTLAHAIHTLVLVI
jgi:hypothetical protein